MQIKDMVSCSFDTFLDGHLSVAQNRNGYRFSIDAVILAAHAGKYHGQKVVDLGTGCGIIPLIMACRDTSLTIFAIELQKDLADLARINVSKNRLSAQIEIICCDLKKLNQKMVGGAVDLIVTNPPYRKVTSGRINPDSERALARHEIAADLKDITACAGRMLRTCGKFMVIYPAERLTELITSMQACQIEPKSLRAIHSDFGSDAKLVLVEGAKRGQPGIQIIPPLYIYQEKKRYTEEVEQMFKPQSLYI